MDKWVKIILGLALIVAVLLLVTPGMPLTSWGAAAWTLIKGGITILIAIMGIALIILGISELRN